MNGFGAWPQSQIGKLTSIICWWFGSFRPFYRNFGRANIRSCDRKCWRVQFLSSWGCGWLGLVWHLNLYKDQVRDSLIHFITLFVLSSLLWIQSVLNVSAIKKITGIALVLNSVRGVITASKCLQWVYFILNGGRVAGQNVKRPPTLWEITWLQILRVRALFSLGTEWSSVNIEIIHGSQNNFLHRVFVKTNKKITAYYMNFISYLTEHWLIMLEKIRTLEITT